MKLLGFKKIIDKILDRKNNKLMINLWNNEDISLPIMTKLDNGKIVDTVFIYTKPTSPDGADVGLPTALVKINSSNGDIMEYKLCDEDTFSFNRYKPIRCAALDIKNRDYNVKRLYEVYDKLRDFAFNTKVTSQESIVLAEFKALFYKTVYKAHIPYYHELGEEFFKWMNEQLA